MEDNGRDRRAHPAQRAVADAWSLALSSGQSVHCTTRSEVRKAEAPDQSIKAVTGPGHAGTARDYWQRSGGAGRTRGGRFEPQSNLPARASPRPPLGPHLCFPGLLPATGEGNGARGSCSAVLVNTSLGSHFCHPPHPSPLPMPHYRLLPTPATPFLWLHNELIVLRVI